MKTKFSKYTLLVVAGMLIFPFVGETSVSAASTPPKITISFVGDCASSPTNAAVTDSTIACALQVSIKPARRYMNLQVIRRCNFPEPLGTCFPDRYARLKTKNSKLAMGYAIAFADGGYFNTNAKGVATLPILRESEGCLIKGGQDNLIVEWTNAKKRGGVFTQMKSSSKAVLSFNVTWPKPNVPITGCATFLLGS